MNVKYTTINDKTKTFYLWLDNNSKPNKPIFYITDYCEKNEKGFHKIDNFGFLDVELIYLSPNKNECLGFAQKFIR